MKKLSVVMAVVLGLALVFSVAGMAGQDVLCKATGGAQLDLGGEKGTFTFNAIVYENNDAKGSALLISEYGKFKFDIIRGVCLDDNTVGFQGKVISSTVEGIVGDTVNFSVKDGGNSGADDLVKIFGSDSELEIQLLGGNIVVRSYVEE